MYWDQESNDIVQYKWKWSTLWFCCLSRQCWESRRCDASEASWARRAEAVAGLECDLDSGQGDYVSQTLEDLAIHRTCRGWPNPPRCWSTARRITIEVKIPSVSKKIKPKVYFTFQCCGETSTTTPSPSIQQYTCGRPLHRFDRLQSSKNATST